MVLVLRSILSVIVGFVAASIVMMLFEIANGNLIYPELGKAAHGVTDREVLRTLLANAPTGAFLVVIAGWISGAFAGGCTAALIAGRAKLVHSIVLGFLLTLAGVANNLMIPPPVWFWFASLTVLLPSAYLGGRLMSPKTVADKAD